MKRACCADWLRDHRLWANQVRLLLHHPSGVPAAYWPLDTLRRWLATRRVERMQLDTLRLGLLKIGGRVWQRQDRVPLRLAASHPGQSLGNHLAAYQQLHDLSG